MERIVLTASEGMLYTKDGVSAGKVVYLSEGQTADGWYEIPENEYWEAFENGFAADAATERDYLEALEEFGVKV